MASFSVSTVTHTVTTTATASPAAAAARAPNQGGIIQGANPSRYDPKNPIIMFIIQAGIIIIFCRILHFPLSKLRQPRVIAEIIGGILLGPSVMGRIPGFTEHIFPTASMATLSTAANLGLILFLFLVGLEVDLRLLVSNWRIALSVGAAGMALPFGLGCGIAYGLYHQFRDDAGLKPVAFGTYMLFAFPVLCRILTELKLLQTQVGVVVLSAGVGNDVVGWILLALCVALVNSGSGIAALWVLLTAVAYVLFLVYAVRPVFMWILRRTGSLQNGPSQTIVALTILMTVASAFWTGIIGVHPIFGAFLIGLICPHDGGFAIKLTEKVEDLVAVFFLPLYFALSGLSTNIGLLDNGITWAYVIGVIAVAFVGKFVGGTIAARFCNMVWRESFTIGALMSCKGLVELIVLNIGYQAKILSQRTFTIFVVMALITTFATTPLTLALYPVWYRNKLAAWKRGDIDWDGNELAPSAATDDASHAMPEKLDSEIRRLLVFLRLDSLPSLFTIVSLLGDSRPTSSPTKSHPSKDLKRTGTATPTPPIRPLQIHGLRLVELTERLSSVMKESEIDDYSHKDPVVNAFHTFGQLSNAAVSGEVHIAPESAYADALVDTARAQSSDLVLLPWSESGKLSEWADPTFESAQSQFSSSAQNQFVTEFLSHAPCNAAVFVNNGFGAAPNSSRPDLPRTKSLLSIRSNPPAPPTLPVADRSHHIFFPFFGGVDDRVALRFVLRLARSANVTATIVKVIDVTGPDDETLQATSASTAKTASSVAVIPVAEAERERDASFFGSLRDSLPSEIEARVLFTELSTSRSGTEVVEHAKREVGLEGRNNAGDVIVLGRGRKGAVGLAGSLGAMAEKMLQGGVQGSVCIIKAGGRGLDE